MVAMIANKGKKIVYWVAWPSLLGHVVFVPKFSHAHASVGMAPGVDLAPITYAARVFSKSLDIKTYKMVHV
jgi:hypothetical protein